MASVMVAMFVLSVINLNVFNGLTMDVQTMHQQETDFQCLIQNKQSTIASDLILQSKEERVTRCLVNCSYDGLDIYGCYDSDCNASVKYECLMCGLPVEDTNGLSLCPNRRDDPESFLTCADCKDRANVCKNNGTAWCPLGQSYAWEMKCHCEKGFTGLYCEQSTSLCSCKIETEIISDIPNCADNASTPCYISIGQQTATCTCTGPYIEQNLENKVPFCNRLPTWIYGNWTKCSSICGEGVMERTINCVRKADNGSLINLTPSDCSYLVQKDVQILCAFDPCPEIRDFNVTFYQRKPMSRVSLLAGMNAFILNNTSITIECRAKYKYRRYIEWFQNGQLIEQNSNSNTHISRKRKLKIFYNVNEIALINVYTCRIGNSNVSSTIQIVFNQNKNLTLVLETATRKKDPFDRQHRNLSLAATAWSSCSKLCGAGYQTRQISCEIITDDYFEVFQNSDCLGKGENISKTRVCNTHPCENWRYTSWSACSRTCEGGVMERTATCHKLLQNGTYITVTEKDCKDLSKHKITKECNLYNCSVRQIMKTDVDFFQLDFVSMVNLHVGMNASVLLNSKLLIHCRTRGIDRASVVWFKDGLPISRFKSMRISKKCKIRIKSVNSNHRGTYCCKYKDLQECINIQIHNEKSVKEFIDGHSKYTRHNASLLYIKDPFDRRRKNLTVLTTDWSACSATCGKGVQTRHVRCEIITESYIEVFKNINCFNKNVSFPLLQKQCFSNACGDILKHG